MSIKIKNWSKFQHFKDRNPPWIKLHKEILNQRDIMMISDCNFRILICLWLLASEDENKEGALPEIPDIAFRLRKKESEIIKAIQDLSIFFERDDIGLISSGYQSDIPETETETETETESIAQKKVFERVSQKDLIKDFNEFWNLCPRKVGKGSAEKTYMKMRNSYSKRQIHDAMQLYKGNTGVDDKKFIPHPSTWLNDKRFLDEGFSKIQSSENWPEWKFTLAAHLGDGVVHTWFEQVEIKDGIMFAPTNFRAEFIDKNYMEFLCELGIKKVEVKDETTR